MKVKQEQASQPIVKSLKLNPVNSNGQFSDAALTIINEMALTSYDKMPDKFRAMISYNNPCLSLFHTACNLPTALVKSKYKSLGFMVEILKGEMPFSCSRCFRLMNDNSNWNKHE